MADFTLRGVSDMRRNLTDIAREKRERLSTAAEEEAEAIVSRSRDEFVPIDSGELRDSIRVVKGSLSQGRNDLRQFTSGSDIEVIVTAGGDNVPHALAVHEHPSRHDPPSWEGVQVQFHPSGRGPKFLERPLLDAVQGMAERAGRKVAIGMLLSLLSVSTSYAQISGISARAFPVQTTIANLPTASTAAHGLRIVTNSLDCETVGVGIVLCLDTGTVWELVSGGGGSDDQTASEVPITDIGLFYSGTEVESALQQIGADTRWTDSRTPTAHNQTSSTITDFTSATQSIGDVRYSLLGHTHTSSGITDFTVSVQIVGDARYSLLAHLHNLQDLAGAVTDTQVPNNITISNIASKCARYDSSGNLVAASGDCISGDTDTAGSPPGSDKQLIFNNAGSFGADSNLVWDLVNDRLGIKTASPSRELHVTGSVRIETTGSTLLELMGAIGGWTGIEFYKGASRTFNVEDLNVGDLSISRASTDTDMRVKGTTGIISLGVGLQFTPRVSPPVVCGDANTLGVEYVDTSLARCFCDGTTWQVLNPLTVGVGTCS